MQALPRALELSASTVLALDEATAATNRLAGIGRLLPNPALLYAPHVRLEAVLSSRIEGTQSTVSDLLRYEAGAREDAPADAQEVANYVEAFDHGLRRLQEGFPLSLRLLRELHERLLAGVRGQAQTPGEFRRSQNWIGAPGCTLAEASFVPPPVAEMHDALADLERYLHEDGLPLLVRVALAHYQFEAIHPFLDGNGRIGRLLVPLILIDRGVLQVPLLYLSAFFERERDTYYDLLLATSQQGDLEPWLDFFLTAVTVSARDAEERTVRLVELQTRVREDLLGQRVPVSVVRLGELLASRPVVTVSQAAELLGVRFPTAQRAIGALVERGLLVEVTGRSRGRVYVANAILEAVYGEPLKLAPPAADIRLSERRQE